MQPTLYAPQPKVAAIIKFNTIKIIFSCIILNINKRDIKYLC